jgi:hypothetical protein
MAESRVLPLQPKRYLGLELAGAKNQKTSLAVLEYYPKERKVFLLDIYDKISGHAEQTGDEALLETLNEATQLDQNRVAKLGVNVPITLPPCIGCTKPACRSLGHCSGPVINWMSDLTEQAKLDEELGVNILEFTPYTQRPFELWARYKILPLLPPDFRFEIDEALGGNRAPLTARMHFLSKHLTHLPIVEVWPKLTISVLAVILGIPKRVILKYRKPEEGYQARMDLLEAIALKQGVFIYERDLKKLAGSLTAFDSFLCAYTAMLSDLDLTAKPPKGFPKDSGWVQFPIRQVK